MPFVPPTFNLVGNLWRASTWVASAPGYAAPPDILHFPCQLRGHLKQLTLSEQFFYATTYLELSTDKAEDLRGPKLTGSPLWTQCDVVEVPSGSSNFYYVAGVTQQGRGFMNEYRSAALIPTWIYEGTFFNTYPGWPFAPAWPVPYSSGP